MVHERHTKYSSQIDQAPRYTMGLSLPLQPGERHEACHLVQLLVMFLGSLDHHPLVGSVEAHIGQLGPEAVSRAFGYHDATLARTALHLSSMKKEAQQNSTSAPRAASEHHDPAVAHPEDEVCLWACPHQLIALADPEAPLLRLVCCGPQSKTTNGVVGQVDVQGESCND